MRAPVREMKLLLVVAAIAVLSLMASAARPPIPLRANPPRLEADRMGLINQLTPLPRGEYTDRAESQALQWTEDVLTPAFAPPAKSRFVLLPMDRKTDLVDRMMLAYVADGAKVTVAQSSAVFLVEIERPEWIKEKRLLKTEEILAEVRRVFKDARAVKVTADYELQGWMTADPEQVAKHIWFNCMGWTQSEGHLALWCLKETGGSYIPTLLTSEGYKWFSYAAGENGHTKPMVSKPSAAPPEKGQK